MTGAQPITDLTVSTLVLLRDRIAKFQKTAEEEGDPEQIHQLRVNLRKLRAALLLFGSVAVFPKKLSDNTIGDIARRFGKKRDSDILTKTFDEIASRTQIADKTSAKIVKALDKERRKTDKDIPRALKSKKFEKLKDSVDIWIKKPQFTPEDISASLLIKKKFSSLKMHEAWDIIHTLDLDKEIELLFTDKPADMLHDLRKQVKVFRYQLEFLRSQQYTRLIILLKTLQDALGAIQDTRVLKIFLDDTLKHSWMQNFPPIFENMKAKVRASLFEARKTAPLVLGISLT